MTDSKKTTMSEYQERAWRTAPMSFPHLEEEINPENIVVLLQYDRIVQLMTFALGIAGEAGEVADLIKKHVGHGHALDKNKLTKELGDVLWYIAAIAKMNEIDLQTVADENFKKLSARYPEGFSSEQSINRKGE